MKIYGTGIDIVEIKRVKKLIEDNNKFRDRVFTKREISYCEGKKKKYEHYAVRFAAKESVWKALGRSGVALKNIEVRNEPNGKPCIRIKNNGLGKKQRVIVSLSHTGNYAVAHSMVVE